MKNNFFPIIILCLVNCAQTVPRDVLLEAKAACFIPTAHRFRNIYHEAGQFGVELTGKFYKGLYGWISQNVVVKNGHSIGECDRTRVLFVPINFGLKYLHRFNWIDLYLGLGASATYLQTKDHSPFVICKQSIWGGGGIVKSGLNLCFTDHFFLDIFADYSFVKINFCRTNGGKVVPHNANISGVSVGAGLGFRF